MPYGQVDRVEAELRVWPDLELQVDVGPDLRDQEPNGLDVGSDQVAGQERL